MIEELAVRVQPLLAQWASWHNDAVTTLRDTRRIVHEGRRVSTTLRHMLTEFSEFFHVSWTGLLIQASMGTTGGLGALRTKRSG
jgi:hypothetical protein